MSSVFIATLVVEISSEEEKIENRVFSLFATFLTNKSQKKQKITNFRKTYFQSKTSCDGVEKDIGKLKSHNF